MTRIAEDVRLQRPRNAALRRELVRPVLYIVIDTKHSRLRLRVEMGREVIWGSGECRKGAKDR